ALSETTSIDGSQNLVYETDVFRNQLNDSLKEIHQRELRIQQLNSQKKIHFPFSFEIPIRVFVRINSTSVTFLITVQFWRGMFKSCK
ncbi:Golgin subfamily B member 1, partial [Galemys pyrenaicus]